MWLWSGPRSRSVGPEVRTAQRRRLRLPGHAPPEPIVANAERRARRLCGQARGPSAPRCRHCEARARRRGRIIPRPIRADRRGDPCSPTAGEILLLAPMPRGLASDNDSNRALWQQAAGANAAVISRLTDGKSVFYDDFGDRFFLPDGSYNHDYWNGPGRGAGAPAARV